MMTFHEAVKIVEEYAAGYVGANLGLLDGLEAIKAELSYGDEDAEMLVTPDQVMAYHIVCREMRKLFV